MDMRFSSFTPIILAHFLNETWASSLIIKEASGSKVNPELNLAHAKAFKLFSVPPLAAMPPDELPKPTSLANHLHKSFSIMKYLEKVLQLKDYYLGPCDKISYYRNC